LRKLARARLQRRVFEHFARLDRMHGGEGDKQKSERREGRANGQWPMANGRDRRLGQAKRRPNTIERETFLALGLRWRSTPVAE
jgi:hypothetical protein